MTDIVTKWSKLYKKSSFWQSNRPEYCVILLYLVLYCFITAFHEPWFDEAQAWQIGKCASLHDLLFEIPHYEGHPAFWSLILAVPAKLGAPFEVSLKTIGFIVSAMSAYLILFKTGLPRFARIVLPFNYFVFYQYGVIVRPYCFLVLFFLILSIVFPNRHKKPWTFIIILMLLCLTGAYAIVMAGGIACCFLLEIVQEKGIKRILKEFFSDQRVVSLLALLIFAILLIGEILPRKDTLVTSREGATNPFLLCLFTALFTFIGESTLTTGSWFSSDTMLLQQIRINTPELVAFSILGLILWFIIIGVSSRRLLKYYVVPYIMFSLFASAVYYSVHHMGVVYSLLLFWLVILFQDSNRYEIGRKWISSATKTEHDKKLLTYPAFIIGVACLMIPVYWCVSACIQDVQKEYSCGRTVSEWIQEKNLEDCSFLNVWGQGRVADNSTFEERLRTANTYIVGMPVEINAYFDHNICFNLNFGRDDEAYMHYRMATEEENKVALERWAESGIPDILLQHPRLQDIYGDQISYDDYILVKILHEHRIWKNNNVASETPIFARKDIVDRYALEPIQDDGLDYFINGITITDEMKEQYENGVPVEEILKPYLDAIFGEEE